MWQNSPFKQKNDYKSLAKKKELAQSVRNYVKFSDVVKGGKKHTNFENSQKKTFLFNLPGYKFDTSVNGTHRMLTKRSAIAKFPINLLVSVRICGVRVTTRKTAIFPTIPIILIKL